jgi:hypothetical protein
MADTTTNHIPNTPPKKRGPSPLELWKDEYGYVSWELRELKKSIREGKNWGSFKVPRQQSYLARGKNIATQMMYLRDYARDEAQRMSVGGLV